MSRATAAELRDLLDRLKEEQRFILDEAARNGRLPARSQLREISDLENTIAALDALIDERRGQ